MIDSVTRPPPFLSPPSRHSSPCFWSSRWLSAWRARSVSTRSSRSDSARSTCCSARSSASSTNPGLHFLLAELGPGALIVNFLGRCYTLDMRLDQQYLRSQPVNSEEGAPMGIGIWYEMCISDPVSYLFKNADPRGSLAANVSNATVRCLSNMKLAEMLENRHTMSQTVRAEVSPQSEEWGYKLGSVYIRKVHFRDVGMIQQIEKKVVNRLRQVTSADQAGRGQPGQRHHQRRRTRGGGRIRQGRRDPPADRRRRAADHLAGSGDLQGIVRDPRNPEHPRGQSGDRTGTPRPNFARRPHRLPDHTTLPSELKCASTALESENW